MRRAGLTIALFCLTVGCGTPARVAAIRVDLDEFSIDASSTSLIAGEVDIEIENYGEFPHTLVVSDEAGDVVAATNVLDPGSTTSLTLDLPEGQYEFTCRIVASDEQGAVIDHYELGMHTTLDSST